MKHAFWDRLLIVLCTLILLAVAALLLGMITGLVPLSLVTSQISMLLENRGTRIVVSAAAVLLVIFALLVFWIILPRRRRRFSTFAIQQTEHGALKISVKALEHLVQKCVSQHPELSVVSSTIHSNEETVRVDMRVTLQSDINIPLAISSLQKQIKQYVEACSGVDVDEVRVVVEATVPPVPGTNSPFAIPDMLQPHLPKLVEANAPAAVLEPPTAEPPIIAAPVTEVPIIEPPVAPAEVPEEAPQETLWIYTEPQAEPEHPTDEVPETVASILADAESTDWMDGTPEDNTDPTDLEKTEDDFEADAAEAEAQRDTEEDGTL